MRSPRINVAAGEVPATKRTAGFVCWVGQTNCTPLVLVPYTLGISICFSARALTTWFGAGEREEERHIFKTSTLHPPPSTLHPPSSTLNPEPSIECRGPRNSCCGTSAAAHPAWRARVVESWGVVSIPLHGHHRPIGQVCQPFPAGSAMIPTPNRICESFASDMPIWRCISTAFANSASSSSPLSNFQFLIAETSRCQDTGHMAKVATFCVERCMPRFLSDSRASTQSCRCT